MDDKIRDPKYRVDLLKLKHKLFSQYPKGSLEYKKLMQEEKIKELINLNGVLAQYPKEETEELLKAARKRVKQFKTLTWVSLLGIVVFGTGTLLISIPALEFLYGVVTVGCMSTAIYGLKEISDLQKAELKFLKAEKTILNEIDKLSRDVNRGL